MSKSVLAGGAVCLSDPRCHHQSPAFGRRADQREATMRIPFHAGMTIIAVASGLAMSSNAMAATTNGTSFSQGNNCQLSIPTTDTKFRPKATGARNESTTSSSFVICPQQGGITAYSPSVFTMVLLALYSIDGSSHAVSCTAVSGWLGVGYAYSTKTVAVSDSSSESVVGWSAVDFGGTSGDPITNSLGFSITCNLPPQTAINGVQGFFTYEIGT